MRPLAPLFAATAPLLLATAAEEAINPHLTLSVGPTAMSVSWSMLESTQPANSTAPEPPATTSRVAWGLSPEALDHVVTNSTTYMTTLTEDLSTYNYCGFVTETRSLHRVRLEGLPAGTIIHYEASFTRARSSAPPLPPPVKGQFRTAPLAPAASLRFLVTADMGDSVSKDYTAIPQMVKQCSEPPGADEGAIGLGVMVGDISYNLDLPPNGDNFMSGMSAMSRNVPVGGVFSYCPVSSSHFSLHISTSAFPSDSRG